MVLERRVYRERFSPNMAPSNVAACSRDACSLLEHHEAKDHPHDDSKLMSVDVTRVI